MKTFSFALLGMLITVFVGTARAQDDYGTKIIGKWEVTKAASELPVGSIVEFTKDLKLNISVKSEGGDVVIAGTYKVVEKDKLAVKIPINDVTLEETLGIKKLTDDNLEIEDKEKKKVDVFKRKK